MNRTRKLQLALVAVVVGAMPVAAQGLGTYREAVKKAEGAANATNRNIAAQTGQDVKTVGKQSAGKTSGPGSQPQSADAKAAADAAGPTPTNSNVMPQVTREIYSYEGQGRRDPFYSLILTEELRPLLSDLKLVGILFSGGGGSGKSVAIMRDVQTNAQYRVSSGMQLGRMIVSAIRPRAVIFTIDEFGLKRQDSLYLTDSLKTRIR